MSDIDWLAVDMVCQGTRIALSAEEKRMVLRRLSRRMLSNAEPAWMLLNESRLSTEQVAERLATTSRSVLRYQAELPHANQTKCPVCREPMWVLVDSGIVEPHADRIYEQCPMSGRPMLSGLAAVRPDLFLWIHPSEVDA